MDWLKSLLFGLVSGVTRLLPISGSAHEAVLLKMFGREAAGDLMMLSAHLAILLALVMLTFRQWSWLLREQKIYRMSSRRRPRPADSKAILQLRLLERAGIIMGISMVFTFRTAELSRNLGILSLLLLINGFLLMIPSRSGRGNKDARSIAALDGILVGIGGGLGTLSGISAFGSSLMAMLLRGFDPAFAAQTCLLAMAPSLAGVILGDLVRLIISGGTAFSVGMAGQCLVIALGAFLGAFYGILAIRRLWEKAGFSQFSFYSWGFALFTFVLYLIV